MKSFYKKFIANPLIYLMGILALISLQPEVAHSQCGFNGWTNLGTMTAPTVLGNRIQMTTCHAGGYYTTVNLVCGATYRFDMCNVSPYFDTQISIYREDNAAFVAYNDDACNVRQSDVTFTAPYSGLHRVVVNQYFCTTYAVCTPMFGTLVSCPTMAAPTALAFSNLVCNDRVRVTFTGAACAASYRVDVASDPGFSTILINNATVTGSPFDITGLTNNTGTLYVRIRSFTSCGGNNIVSANSATLVIPVTPPQPTIDQQSLNVCSDETGVIYSVTPDPGATYTWDASAITGLGATAVASGGAGEILTVDFNNIPAGTYNLIVTPNLTSSGCDGPTSTIAVVVEPGPAPTAAAAPATVCPSAQSTLTSTSGVAGTTFQWDPGALPGASVNVNPAVTTTYTVTATTPAGCTGTNTVTVNVFVATAVAVNPASVNRCPSDPPSQLTASGVTSYAWGPVAGLSSTIIANPTANPAATTTYTVTGTDANGCTSTATVLVTVLPPPTVTINPAAVSRCRNASPSILTASGATTYSWTPAAGLSDPNIANPGANPATTTTYTVVGTNGSGCTGSATVVVTVLPDPTVIITPNATTICAADPATTFTASGATSYVWSSGDNTAAISVNPGVTTTYTVTGTDANGCTNTATAVLTVNPNPPTPTPQQVTTPVCPGQLTTVYNVVNVPGTTYTWTVPAVATLVSGQGTNSITVNWVDGGNVPAPAGTYNITVAATALNCNSVNPLTMTVTVLNPPPAQPSAPVGPTPICVNTSGNYSVTNDPTATSYNWTGLPPGAFISAGINTNAITINWGAAAPGTYTINVTASNSCGTSPSNSIIVDVITVRPQPSVITPPANICVGQTATFSVTNDTDPTVTGYTWTNSCGWTGTSTTNSIDYTPTAGGPCIITVVVNNTCGSSAPRSLTVTPSDVPAQPIAISGQTNICPNQVESYTVTNVPGVTYTWATPPAGATIISGQGTNTVRINWGTATPQTFTLTVTPSNACGNGTDQTIDIIIEDVPGALAGVTGPTVLCAGQSGAYSVTTPPANTTFAWTVSPAGPTLAPSGSNLSAIFPTAGTFTLTVTPSNRCGVGLTPTSYTVNVLAPTVITTQSIVTACTPNTSLTATPGGGTWACASCPGGATVDNAGNVSGMNIPGGNYVFSYTVNNPPCETAIAYTTVRYDVAVGGTVSSNATICSGGSGTVSLSGQSGTVTRWERSTDCVTYNPIVNVSSSYTYINLTQTTCFRAVVQRGTCPEVTSSSVTITVTPRVTPTASPATQSVCAATATVTGNLPVNTTGVWSFVTGPTVATITTSLGTGNITGMTLVGTYTFRWTLSNPPCPAQSVEVTVTRTPALTVPNAGNDQNICSDRATLTGNIPVVGMASWSYVSGPSANPPTLQPVNQNIALVSGLTTPGSYIFRYTIMNATCGTLTDDVTITVGTPPTTADAGLDMSTCDPTATVQGNIPVNGTGTWTFVTGPTVASITQINNIGNITGMTVPGDYYFRWSIANPPCLPSRDEVKITVINQPSAAAVAQTLYNLCDQSTVTLRALRPQFGMGTWAFVSGPATPSVLTQGTDGVVTNMTAVGTYSFSWTVTNPPCAGTSTVTVDVVRETAITDNISAGPNQVLCNVTTTTLNSPTPIPARSTGTWVYVSGPVANVTVTTNGTSANVINMDLPGIYVFEWRVKRTAGNCAEVRVGMTVEIKPSPTTANAGADQTICGTSATLTGNIPMIGTGTWTQVSGPSASINQSNNTAFVTGMNTAGAYTFRYSIANAPCTPSTDDVVINVSVPAVGGFVASDATVCAGTNSGTLTLTGHSGAVVRWESSTNNFGTFSVIGNTTTTQAYNNLNTTTWYRAVLKNGTCPEVTSTPATITVNQLPTVANAGVDKTFCGTVSSTNLIGNVPAVGTATWTFQNGPTTPSFSVAGSIVNIFGISTPGTYTFCYTISNPPCAPSQDCASIIVSPQTIAGTVISPATVCTGANSGTLTLTGNNGSVVRWEYSTDNITWIPIANVTSTQNYSNLTMTRTYRAVVASGTCPETPSVAATITVSAAPTVANAGADQSFCGNVTSATLTGNLPVNGTGSWSFVSGPATPNVTSNNNIGQATGMNVDGMYIFRYTIANPPCTPSMDDVMVTRFTQSIGGTLASAATVCSGTNAGTLTVSGFNGSILRWESSNDGFANNIVPIANTTAVYAYNNLTQTTTYRVVSQAGACTEAMSTMVTITVNPATPLANGGPGATVCASFTTLTAVQPLVGTGTWSFITGPSPASITTNGVVGNVSGMTLTGTYTFRWTINNAPCPSTTADVIIARLPDGVMSNAGADVTTCNTSVTLTGNNPAPGNGSWSQVSGPASSIVTSGVQGIVTGLNTPGTYVYRWSITQAPCQPSTDDVVVTVLAGPSPAQVASQSMVVCDANVATLMATAPVNGTGSWSFISGPVVASVTGSPIGNVTNMTTNGTYIFRWTVINPPCSQVNTVDVVVSRQSGLNVNAFAGANQSVCDNQFALVVGNAVPLGATGQWAFVNGPAVASITTIGNFGSITSMSLPGDYVFSWTITPSNGCPSSTSLVTVTRVSPPTPATAGPISTICGNSVVLNGNTPTSGTGAWSFVSGPMTPTLNALGTTATISDMNMSGVYIFRWSITNAPCTPSAFDVPVTVNAGSESGILNGAATVCSGTNNGTLTLTGHRGTIVRWEVSTDNFNSFTAINNVSPNLPYNNLTQTTCYRVIVKEGTCPEAASNIVCINVNLPTPVANGGPNQTVCGTSVNLVGNVPNTGTPIWSFLTGPATPVLVQSNTTAVISNMSAAGTYMFKYTIDNSPCGMSEAIVMVMVNTGSVAGSAGPNRTVCAGTNSGNIALTGHTGMVVRWESSMDNITWNPIANTTANLSFSNLTATMYYRAVVKDGGCPEAFSTPAMIMVNQAVIANAGPSQSLCGSTIATVNGNMPMSGTGTWSFISGPVPATISTNGTTGSITGMTTGGTYVFRWTINNPPCAVSSSDVSITTSPVTVAGSVSMPMTVCGGNNTGTLVLTGFVGNVLRWESSVDNFATTTIIHLNPTPQHTFVNESQTIWYRAVVQSGSCNVEISQSAKITVVPPTTPANGGGNQTVCTPNTTLTGNMPMSGTTNWVFVTGPATAQVVTNGNIGTVTGMNIPGNYIFRYTITNAPCASSSVNVQVTVLNPINPGNVAGAATVCAGANSGSVVLSGNGGAVIRWESATDMNGPWSSIGNTGNTQTYSNLMMTTWFRAVINGGACGAIFTNPVQITVSPASVGGSVAQATTVCSGSNSGMVTLSGHVGNVVKWQSSTDGINWSDLANQTAMQSFLNLSQTTFFRAEVKSGTCASAFSSSVQITVTPASVGGVVANNTTVCGGSNAGTLVLSGNIGTVVKWQSSLDGINWSDIVNATQSQSFSNLTQSTMFRAVVQNANCNVANSIPAMVTVSPATVAGTLGNAQTVCGGNNSGVLNVTNNVGSVVRWEVSTDGGNSFTTINNQTTTLTFNNLATTSIYRVVVQSGACASANTNNVTITVDQGGNGGVVIGSANVCQGPNNGVLTLSGHNGSILGWEFSTDGGFTWTPIANNTNTQSYVNLVQTTAYRAVVSSIACGGQVFSQPATVTVSPLSNAGFITGNIGSCGGSATGTLTLNSFVGNVVRWESSTDNINFSAINVNSPSLNYNVSVTTYFRAIVQSGGCPQAVSGSVEVAVSPASVGGTLASSASVCSGNNSGVVTLSGHVGMIMNWEQSVDGGLTFTSIANQSNVQTYSNLTQTTIYRVVVQSGVCPPVFSSTVTITVLNNLALAAQAVVGCNGQANVFARATGGTGQYVYSINPQVQANNDNGNFTNVPQGTYTITVSDGSGCTANATVTVNAGPTAPVINPVSNITQNTAFITWPAVPPGAGVFYTVRYRILNTQTWTQIGNITNTFQLLQNLQNNTTYEVQLAFRCGSNGPLSPFSNGFVDRFTTLSMGTCSDPVTPIPGGIYVNQVSGTSAVVNWNLVPGAAGYIVSYGLISQNPNSWGQFVVCNPQNTFLMSNLFRNTQYGVRVRTNCSNCTTALNNNDIRSVYSAVFNYQTLNVREGIAETNTTADIAVYPNPTKGNVTVSYESTTNTLATVQIFDVTGRMISVQEVSLAEGANNMEIDLTNQTAGVYMMRFTVGNEIKTVKIVRE